MPTTTTNKTDEARLIAILCDTTSYMANTMETLYAESNNITDDTKRMVEHCRKMVSMLREYKIID